MNYFVAAFGVESYKLRRSVVPWLALLFLLFIVTQEAGKPDWNSYLEGAVYRFAILGSLGFGFVTSWLFGREYSERTFKDLLALPVSRSNLVLAKFATVCIGCSLMTLIVFVYTIGLGMVVHLPEFSWNMVLRSLSMFALTFLFNMLLCTLVAFLASCSRGLLAPIGFVFFTLILAVSIGGGAVGPYLPWAIPTLQTLNFNPEEGGAHSLNMLSYLILSFTGVTGLISTLAWWRYSDQK